MMIPVGFLSSKFEVTARSLGFQIKGDEIHDRSAGGPIAGARAIVETAGQLRSRMTMTRLAMIGPFALAAKKKIDERELYIYIDGAEGWQLMAKVDPKRSEEARRWVTEFNNRSVKAAAGKKA